MQNEIREGAKAQFLNRKSKMGLITLTQFLEITNTLDINTFSNRDILVLLKTLGLSTDQKYVDLIHINQDQYNQLIYVVSLCNPFDPIMTLFYLEDVDQDQKLDDQQLIKFFSNVGLKIHQSHLKMIQKLSKDGLYEFQIIKDFVYNMIQ